MCVCMPLHTHTHTYTYYNSVKLVLEEYSFKAYPVLIGTLNNLPRFYGRTISGSQGLNNILVIIFLSNMLQLLHSRAPCLSLNELSQMPCKRQ